jgi:predicted RND superfamily exporter protein
MVEQVLRLLQHPKAVLAVLAVLTIAIGHRALFVVQDNSPESFFAVDRAAQATHSELVRVFHADEVVLVELRGARTDRADDVRAVAELARALAGVDGVRHTMSVADIYLEPDAVEVAAPTDAELAAVAAEVAAVDLYGQLGIARPQIPSLGVVASLVVPSTDARPALVEAIRAQTARYQGDRYEISVAGLTAAHAAVDREGRRTMTLFMPFVVVLIGLVGFAIFRSVKVLIAMLLPVGAAVLLGVAALELWGKSMNLVSGVMPPLVQAIGFAGATHLVSRYATLISGGQEPQAAVRQTVRDKLAPTAFAFATTAVGFGSLATSSVGPVQVLGGISAIALGAALVLVTVGTPALLLVLRPKAHMPEHRRELLERAAVGSLRRRWAVLALAVVVIVPIGFGLPKLRTLMDGMAFLADDVPAKRDFRRLEAEGLGLNPFEIWIKKPVPTAEIVLDDARRLRELAGALEEEPLVTGTAGIHDLLESAQFRATGKTDLVGLAALAGLNDEAKRAEYEARAAPFVHPEQGLRLTVLARTAESDELTALAERIQRTAQQSFGDAEVVLTGHYMMLIGTPGKLMSTMVQSLGASVAVIAFLFLLAFRSIWLTLGGMVANVTPVLLTVGLMGWVGIPVDVATVMVGSVAFGVAVDDTFHYLHHRRKSGSIVRAAHIAGQGIVATTFMIAAGFAVLGLSDFGPVARFGLLTSLAVVLALLVDAFLLPALVGERP